MRVCLLGRVEVITNTAMDGDKPPIYTSEKTGSDETGDGEADSRLALSLNNLMKLIAPSLLKTILLDGLKT